MSSEQQGSHFWYMSIHTAGGVLRQFEGHVNPPPTMTRLDLFYRLRAELDARYPDVVGGVVVAFDAQRNTI